MPSPTDLVKPVLGCLGVDFSLSLPSVSITGPTLPAIPGFTPPTIPPLNVPGLDFAFAWSPPSLPGLPATLSGFFGAMLAGINYTLSFLPPDPHHLPSLPTIDLFISGFTAAAPGLPRIPACNLQIPGCPAIPFPGTPGVVVPGWNPSGLLNLIGMFIAAPFLIFKGIITALLNLQIKIPNFDTIMQIMLGIGLALGFPALTLATILPCIVKTAVTALGVLG